MSATITYPDGSRLGFHRTDGFLGTETYLTAADVARVLQVSLRTVTRLRQRGQLHAVRVGAQWRYRPDAIAELGAS